MNAYKFFQQNNPETLLTGLQQEFQYTEQFKARVIICNNAIMVANQLIQSLSTAYTYSSPEHKVLRVSCLFLYRVGMYSYTIVIAFLYFSESMRKEVHPKLPCTTQLQHVVRLTWTFALKIFSETTHVQRQIQ